MDYKKLYYQTLKKVCERDKSDFPNIVEQERPDFMDRVVPNKNAKNNCVFAFMLDEDEVKENDYKDFCEYVYTYIGADFDEIVNENKRFQKFQKQD